MNPSLKEGVLCAILSYYAKPNQKGVSSEQFKPPELPQFALIFSHVLLCILILNCFSGGTDILGGIQKEEKKERNPICKLTSILNSQVVYKSHHIRSLFIIAKSMNFTQALMAAQ